MTQMQSLSNLILDLESVNRLLGEARAEENHILANVWRDKRAEVAAEISDITGVDLDSLRERKYEQMRKVLI